MNTITIEGLDALYALRAVVADKGADHVYERAADDGPFTCLYVQETDGELCPQCIVGHALHHLGVPLHLMAGDVNDENVETLAPHLCLHGYQLTDGATEVLQAAQIVQDSVLGLHRNSPEMANWGAALKAAEKAANSPEGGDG